MKKILYLTSFEPSKHTGGQNFTRLLLKDICQNNKVDLVMFMNEDVDYEIPSKNVEVKKIFYVSKNQKLINSLLTPFLFPFFTVRFNLSYLLQLKKIVKQQNYDYLYIDYSQIFLYGLFFPKQAKILRAHDIITQKYERKGSRFIAKFAAFSEKFILKNQKNVKIFAPTQKDADILLEKVGVVSAPSSEYIEISDELSISNVYKRLVFFGNWKRTENSDGLVWFLDNIYDKIDKSYEVVVIGGGLSDSMKNRVFELENINYMGFMDDPSLLIAESTALIAPIFQGAGVKIKVLESLALGTAVIGSEIAFEGISDVYRKFMYLAKTPEEYANYINNLHPTIEEKIFFKRKFQELYGNNHEISAYINR